MIRPTPTQLLADALAAGDPQRIAAEIERFTAHQIYRATGKAMPEPWVTQSTTTRTYR